MPNRDRTGPWGKGPTTGRGAGKCTRNDVEKVAGFGSRRGWGHGGRGRMFRFRTFRNRGRAWFNPGPASQTKNND
ncbi:MAG: DUF5320 domain-containing protein [Chloroflexi bacterium]|nr:DUF5320 domain-containing protein [Chloroflexota bacterium]